MPPLDQFIGDAIGQVNQNRQYQEFSNFSVIFPVILASAATLLKHQGYSVTWDDAVAEKKKYHIWIRGIAKSQPDFIAMEVKTPVILYYFEIVKDIKAASPNTKIIFMGDHVVELPEESLANGVSYVLKSGDYDIELLNLLEKIEGKKS